jgi:hypothetical protein
MGSWGPHLCRNRGGFRRRGGFNRRAYRLRKLAAPPTAVRHINPINFLLICHPRFPLFNSSLAGVPYKIGELSYKPEVC